MRTATRRDSCSAKLLWFLLKIDFEVVLSEKASANPASLAPTSPRQAGYYYYLLFVDGYSKPSVRSSPGPGSRGAMVLEISSSAPRAAREVRVIKVHFSIAIRSVGCLTLHLTSGSRCPRSTGNRESYKLQRGTLGMAAEALEGRRTVRGLWKWGLCTPFHTLSASTFHSSTLLDSARPENNESAQGENGWSCQWHKSPCIKRRLSCHIMSQG